YTKDPWCCTGGSDSAWLDQVQVSSVACSYGVSPSGYNHGTGAESGSFSVTSPAGCNWTASTPYSWIHSTSSGSGNGTASYNVDANSSISSRSGTITVADQTF